MITKYTIQMSVPDPRKPYEFHTIYENLGGGSYRCGDDPSYFMFFDTYDEALSYAESINKNYHYIVKVEEHVA